MCVYLSGNQCINAQKLFSFYCIYVQTVIGHKVNDIGVPDKMEAECKCNNTGHIWEMHAALCDYSFMVIFVKYIMSWQNQKFKIQKEETKGMKTSTVDN